MYEPYLAAALSYGIIKDHPFRDGNKRTAFFLATEYIHAMGIPGSADGGDMGSATDIAQRHMDVAAGKLGLEAMNTVYLSVTRARTTWAFNVPAVRCCPHKPA